MKGIGGAGTASGESWQGWVREEKDGLRPGGIIGRQPQLTDTKLTKPQFGIQPP